MSEDKLRNSLRPGHKLHWYQIEKVLGQGGFGITYLAYDSNLDQHVAIKEYLPMELAVREGDFSVYPASQAQDERYRWGLDRFLSEARTLAKFRHPAIVRVMSVFESNNTAYMVMEYQDGESLQQILERRRTLPEPELAAIVKPLLDGLDVIHATGFIHRDIKPSNIFVHADGHPVLLDFGSARQALGEQTQTLTSVVSPGYAPFEQYYSKSDRQGPWTDIYGLGATLYRSISGLQPMAAIDRSEAILKAERDVFVPASELGVGRYSDRFLEAIDASLRFNEKRRPQTVTEWREQFDFVASAEFLPEGPAHTSHPGDARTRFEGQSDEAFDVTTGAMFNTEILHDDQRGDRRSRPPSQAPRSTPSEQSEQSRSAPSRASRPEPPRSETRPAAGRPDPRSRPAPSEPPRSEPRSRPPPSEPPRSEPRSRPPSELPHSEPRSRAPASEPPQVVSPRSERPVSYHPHTEPPPPRRRVWPLVLLLLLVGAGAAAWVFRDADFLPDVVVMSKEGREAARLIKQGDRALAAGQVFEPLEGSALMFYQGAWSATPDNPDAAHGLRITTRQLVAAIESAIAAEDSDRAFELARSLSLVPREVFDPTEIRSELVSARGRWEENQKHAERIEAYLAAAREDIDNDRLVGAGTSNALAKYRAIQVLDPDNAAAAGGVREVGSLLAGRAAQALADGDLDTASGLVSQARTLNPEDPQIATADAGLAAVMSEEAAREARAGEIQQLLRDAEDDIGGNRLSSPAGRNALERYRRVLELDPGNPAATRGIDDVHDRYIAQATQALRDADFDRATSALGRARLARPGSPRIAALEQELAIARDRRDRAEAERLAAEAQREIDAAAQARQASEQAQREAELARKRRQEAEAMRLLEEANRKAAAEAAAQQAEAEAVNARPRLVVDFYGFEPKYAQYYLTIQRVEEYVYPLLRNAGYEIVKRDVYHDRGRDWTNVHLLVYRLYVNENTATGLYSYIGSLNLYPQDLVMRRLTRVNKQEPLWTRGQNGLGPPTDLRLLLDAFTRMTEAFLRESRRLQ